MTLRTTEAIHGRGLALVILAAGESSRLSTCKALVPITPLPPLVLLRDAAAGLGGPAPLVVTGADHAAIASAAIAGLELVHNTGWSAGRTGGVHLAAEQRPGHDLLVAPVDTPLVPSGVFAALARAWEAAGRPPRGWAGPWIRDERGLRAFGHPVVIGRELASRVPEIGSGAPLSRLRDLAKPLLAVEVDSPAILDDLDTLEDLLRIRTRSGG